MQAGRTLLVHKNSYVRARLDSRSSPHSPSLTLACVRASSSSLPTAPQNFQKGFIDRIAEALLGGAESEDSPTSKYALICQRCFSHNGLCLKDEILDIRAY